VCILGGTGDLGFGLAIRLAAAGVDVVIGSRRREKAQTAVEEARRILADGGHVSGDVNREAAAGCDVVVLSIPFEGAEEIIRDVSASLTEGCVVVSCIVPFNAGPGEFGSAAERVRALLPSSVQVVSAFHTVSAHSLRRIGEPVNCDTLIFGDDQESKKRVARLAYLVDGLRPVDGGSLKNSRFAEQLTQLLVSINKKYKIGDAAVKVAGLDDKSVMERWGI